MRISDADMDPADNPTGNILTGQGAAAEPEPCEELLRQRPRRRLLIFIYSTLVTAKLQSAL